MKNIIKRELENEEETGGEGEEEKKRDSRFQLERKEMNDLNKDNENKITEVNLKDNQLKDNQDDYENLKTTLMNNISQGFSQEEIERRVAYFYSDDSAHSERLFSYLQRKWWRPSTPILANIPQPNKPFIGMPISCFLIENSNFQNTITEAMFIAECGGGLGIDWSKERKSIRNHHSILSYIKHLSGVAGLCTGKARDKAAVANYISIHDGEILSFLHMRKNLQGIDPEFHIPRSVHHAIIITNDFMYCVEKGENWELSNGTVVDARNLFLDIINTRLETGEPYLLFIDNVNAKLPPHHKQLGLNVKTSNLCTEIVLPTGMDHLGIPRTAICCLSSFNLATFDDYKNELTQMTEDIMKFHDNVLTFFMTECSTLEINQDIIPEKYKPDYVFLRQKEKEYVLNAIKNKHPLRNAFYSAFRERSIGIGVCGLHTYYQLNNIIGDSEEAENLNKQIFNNLNEIIQKTNIKIAMERGACEDSAETDYLCRFSYCQAIAPTSLIASHMGVSECIQPQDPILSKKNQAGVNEIRNSVLCSIIKKHNLNTNETWYKIATDGVNFLPIENKVVFKSPFDCDQMSLIRQTVDRPIDQSQSFNLFIDPKKTTKNNLLAYHINFWKKGGKTMYYLFSKPPVSLSIGFQRSVLNNHVSEKISQDEIKECIMCQ